MVRMLSKWCKQKSLPIKWKSVLNDLIKNFGSAHQDSDSSLIKTPRSFNKTIDPWQLVFHCSLEIKKYARNMDCSSELESDVCYRVYGWRHLVKATEVTTGLAESNSSLPPGEWFSHLRADWLHTGNAVVGCVLCIALRARDTDRKSDNPIIII